MEHDSLGNAIWTRSRADDSPELPDTSALSIVEAPPAAAKKSRSNLVGKDADPVSPRTGRTAKR